MKSRFRAGAVFAATGALLTLMTPFVAAAAPARRPGQEAAAQQLGFDHAALAALDSGFADVVAKGEVPGLTYVLVRHGQVVASNSIGLASTARNLPQRDDGIFRIFSMTKPITGVALMILHEQGKWQLDDPITKFLPAFGNLQVVTGVDTTGKPVTVPAKRPPTMRELMSHTAGFGYGLMPGDPVDDMFRARGVNGAASLAEVADKVASLPLKFQPGQGWSYSIAVDLQARIVEVISGQNFGAFLQQKIFGPLKMTDTAFHVPADKAGRLGDLYGIDPTKRTLVVLPPVAVPNINLNFADPQRLQSGGGGLVSTVGDYGRFAQMILNGGELDGVRLLKPKSVALMGRNVIADGIQPDNGLVKAMGTTAFAFGNGVSFGLDFMVITDPKKAQLPVGKGTLSWGGAAGTWFWIDPENDLYFIGMIQRLGGSAGMTDLPGLSQRLVYQALLQPKK